MEDKKIKIDYYLKAKEEGALALRYMHMALEQDLKVLEDAYVDVLERAILANDRTWALQHKGQIEQLKKLLTKIDRLFNKKQKETL